MLRWFQWWIHQTFSLRFKPKRLARRLLNRTRCIITMEVCTITSLKLQGRDIESSETGQISGQKTTKTKTTWPLSFPSRPSLSLRNKNGYLRREERTKSMLSRGSLRKTWWKGADSWCRGPSLILKWIACASRCRKCHFNRTVVQICCLLRNRDTQWLTMWIIDSMTRMLIIGVAITSSLSVDRPSKSTLIYCTQMVEVFTISALPSSNHTSTQLRRIIAPWRRFKSTRWREEAWLVSSTTEIKESMCNRTLNYVRLSNRSQLCSHLGRQTPRKQRPDSQHPWRLRMRVMANKEPIVFQLAERSIESCRKNSSRFKKLTMRPWCKSMLCQNDLRSPSREAAFVSRSSCMRNHGTIATLSQPKSTAESKAVSTSLLPKSKLKSRISRASGFISEGLSSNRAIHSIR